MGLTILILGGLAQHAARHLLPHLLSEDGPSPDFVRIVDKSLILVQVDAYTTYVDKRAREAFKKGVASGVVEYVQGNLLTDSVVEKAFTLPEKFGGPSASFDWVFDFTGEFGDTPDLVYIERTLKLSLHLGQAAARHKVGVYVKMLLCFYKTVSGKGKVGESVSEPWGKAASWWHESARALGLLKGLKVVLLRPTISYGPYSVTGVTPRVLIGECYKYQGEKLEFLWSESQPQNTIHAYDFATACVSTATWASSVSQDVLLSLAGEEMPSTLKSNEVIKNVDGAAKKEDVVRMPVLNVVDDGATTAGDIAKIVQEVVGVQTGFLGTLISAFAKLNMNEVVEEVNEKHLESWSELLTASNPPISTTVPISPNVTADSLQPYPIDYSNEKLKRLTGWMPKYKLSPDVVRDTVSKFREEGHWPDASPKRKK